MGLYVTHEGGSKKRNREGVGEVMRYLFVAYRHVSVQIAGDENCSSIRIDSCNGVGRIHVTLDSAKSQFDQIKRRSTDRRSVGQFDRSTSR